MNKKRLFLNLLVLCIFPAELNLYLWITALLMTHYFAVRQTENCIINELQVMQFSVTLSVCLLIGLYPKVLPWGKAKKT
jgi:hypothetical protein